MPSELLLLLIANTHPVTIVEGLTKVSAFVCQDPLLGLFINLNLLSIKDYYLHFISEETKVK